jgi:hypothetical protein
MYILLMCDVRAVALCWAMRNQDLLRSWLVEYVANKYKSDLLCPNVVTVFCECCRGVEEALHM